MPGTGFIAPSLSSSPFFKLLDPSASSTHLLQQAARVILELEVAISRKDDYNYSLRSSALLIAGPEKP